MTVAERKQRSRALRAEQGIIDMIIPVKLEQRLLLERISHATGMTKADLLAVMLELGVSEVLRAFDDALAAMGRNTPDADVSGALSKRLGRDVSIQGIKGFREAMTEAV